MESVHSGHRASLVAAPRVAQIPQHLIGATLTIASFCSCLLGQVAPAAADERSELTGHEYSADGDAHPRMFCTEPRPSGCHVLAYPAFVPSTISASYIGIRVGGAYEIGNFEPFPTIGGQYRRVLGSGAIEFSKELWVDHVSLFGSLNGTLGTGVNAGSIIGTDTEAMGGVDIGLVANVLARKSGRIALIDRAMRRYGYSFFLERAAQEVSVNPQDQKASALVSILAPAAGRIPLPFAESGNRFDVAWLWIATPWLSYQGAIGAEFSQRYYRSDDLANAPVIRRLVGPRIGTAFEFDLSQRDCDDDCTPIALVLEHQWSPTRLSINTLAPVAGGAHPQARFVDHLFAIGVHYASDRHSDFDAGLTAYTHFNVPQQLAMTIRSNPTPPLATDVGGQMTARYCW